MRVVPPKYGDVFQFQILQFSLAIGLEPVRQAIHIHNAKVGKHPRIFPDFETRRLDFFAHRPCYMLKFLFQNENGVAAMVDVAFVWMFATMCFVNRFVHIGFHTLEKLGLSR